MFATTTNPLAVLQSVEMELASALASELPPTTTPLGGRSQFLFPDDLLQQGASTHRPPRTAPAGFSREQLGVGSKSARLELPSLRAGRTPSLPAGRPGSQRTLPRKKLGAFPLGGEFGLLLRKPAMGISKAHCWLPSREALTAPPRRHEDDETACRLLRTPDDRLPLYLPPPRHLRPPSGGFDLPLPARDGVGERLTRLRSEVLARELLAPKVIVPHLTNYRDIFAVIDARERSIQAIKGFAASLSYIRGNARAPPPEQLRRLRAKLARLLARLRTHTTNTVELICAWRIRNSAIAIAEQDAAAQDDSCAPSHSADAVCGSALASGAAAQPGPGGEFDLVERVDVLDNGVEMIEGAAGIWSRSGLSRGGLPLGLNVHRTPPAAEPFYWLGWNYLVKITLDLGFAPMPVGSDPLLVNWFHYTSQCDRVEGLLSPPEGGADFETEWWFDVDRLHTVEDTARMRRAQQEILDEVSRQPTLKADAEKSWVEGAMGNAGLNEVGHELELLLYAYQGGVYDKLNRYREQALAHQHQNTHHQHQHTHLQQSTRTLTQTLALVCQKPGLAPTQLPHLAAAPTLSAPRRPGRRRAVAAKHGALPLSQLAGEEA